MMEQISLLQKVTRFPRKLFERKKKDAAFVRQHVRHEVALLAELRLVNRNHPLRGIVNELSTGGMRFRPATVHLYQRADEDCFLSIGDKTFHGTIRNTGPMGYGIQLANPLDEGFLAECLRINRAPRKTAN